MKTSLIITTYNRAALLRNSLERLCHLTLPEEILIIDDGGTDNTLAVFEEFKTRLPIKYYYNNNPGWSICSMARNIGVKEATGDFIITSEPELLWVTDVIPILLREKKRYPREIVSAGIIYFQQEQAGFHPGFYADPTSALKDCIVEDYQIQPRPYHQGGFVKTINMQATFLAAYEKEWLMEVGGWDESFPGAWGFDDIDLCTRLRIKGYNQHICRKLKAIHQWHPHLPPHEQGPAMLANEKHMQDKKLSDEDKNNPNLIANQGKEWGVLR